MRICYSSSAELAKALAAAWVKPGRVAYAQPYNRWKWDASPIWWLVPARDKLAFRYSKIIVSSSPLVAESDQLFVGLYVEKGVGADLARAGYYREEWVLDATWRWHEVIRDLTSGVLGSTIADVSHRIDEPIEIRVDAHVPVVKGNAMPPHDVIGYASRDGHMITAIRQPFFGTEQRFLESAACAHNLPELANLLKTIHSSDYAWINLYIGKAVQKSSLHDTSALDARQLADQFLDPFAPWLR